MDDLYTFLLLILCWIVRVRVYWKQGGPFKSPGASFTNPFYYLDRAKHICVSKLTIICSNNGLSPGRHQAIIWTNAEILLIGPLRTNLSEMLIEIYTFPFRKMHLKMSFGKWRSFCLGLNVWGGWGCEVSCGGHHRRRGKPPRGQLWMEQCLISLKYWPI